jgi:adenylate kinase
MARKVRGRPRPVALTGTPGVGKSSVARRLAPGLRSVEVSHLARREGAATGRGRSLVVDLRRLRAALSRPGALDGLDLVVGHLAHLLPLPRAIVLRCHPLELRERLQRGRRGSRADRQANFVAEATDAVLVEALSLGREVVEVDTTGRTVSDVARRVRASLRARAGRGAAAVDWLADPAVTEHLLDGPT